jgi:hypothetical protein
MTGYGYGMTPGLVSPESRINTPLQSCVSAGAGCAGAAACEDEAHQAFFAESREEVCGTDLDVMGWWVVFGVVIAVVGGARAPADEEVALVGSILDPIEPHVDCLGPLDFGAAVGESVGCGVVRGDAGWLCWGPADFNQDLAKVDCFLTIVKEGGDFGLGGGRHDVSQDAALHVDGAIGSGVVLRLIDIAQVEVASDS